MQCEYLTLFQVAEAGSENDMMNTLVRIVLKRLLLIEKIDQLSCLSKALLIGLSGEN